MVRRVGWIAMFVGVGCLLAADLSRASAEPKGKTAGLSAEETKEGFVNLLASADLTGLWQGATKGYVVKDDPAEGRRLVCEKGGGGNLVTKKDYANFIFRFDFKLTPGANNGVGIRMPATGNGAYGGMEIQILDDTHEKYKGWLKDYQHHGSIYGVVPAKTGFRKPAGQWNTEEICANGRRVKVTLNGTVIVDANLDEAVAKNGGKTLDHQEHPGLKREKGRIGFLGHGDSLEFRNIRVKEL